MRIFLVATCPFVCERLPELLEENGRYIVRGCASTFDAAVEAILANKPDIAVLDIKLDGASGIDAMAEAKHRLSGLLGIVVSNQLRNV